MFPLNNFRYFSNSGKNHVVKIWSRYLKPAKINHLMKKLRDSFDSDFGRGKAKNHEVFVSSTTTNRFTNIFSIFVEKNLF